MSTSPVTTPPTTGTNGLPTGQSLNNMFLQLLVAQLQNQDPTDPVDPSQFVGQLAQFSELSEVTSIYTLLQGFVPASGTGTGSTGGAVPATGSSSPGAAAAAALAANPALALGAANPLSSAATTLSNFASPTISALTSKIQGAF
ncbi:MAG: flagellar hook capping FlgD N-terminal domain-containing protein [Candidatus Sulfotelmatobacter sp.]